MFNQCANCDGSYESDSPCIFCPKCLAAESMRDAACAFAESFDISFDCNGSSCEVKVTDAFYVAFIESRARLRELEKP